MLKCWILLEAAHAMVSHTIEVHLKSGALSLTVFLGHSQQTFKYFSVAVSKWLDFCSIPAHSHIFASMV